jgi:membrane-bound ClpP family serine protease
VVDEISARMSNTLTAVTVVLMVIGMYVLVFSSLSLLYKIVIVVYVFVLLFLFTLALEGLEMMEKPRAEMRSQKACSGRGTWSRAYFSLEITREPNAGC